MTLLCALALFAATLGYLGALLALEDKSGPRQPEWRPAGRKRG